MRTESANRPHSSGGHLTKQQFVYTTLRESIIKCELEPGTRLVIDDLARQFHVSIIPVREALRLLQSDGLVLSVAHVGATVAPISRASVAEVFTVMEGLELVASRAAAQRAEASDLAALVNVLSAMDQALESGSLQQWAELNTRFHLAISRLAEMPILQEMMQRAFDYWDRVRRYYFSDVLVHRARLAQTEHHGILDHLRARDLTRLEQAIRQHNQGAMSSYIAYLESADEGAVREARS